MDKSYIEKYKNEMMALYSKIRPSEAENKAEDLVSPEIEDVKVNAPDDTAYEDFPEDDREESSDIEDEFNQRYPEPDLSDINTDTGKLDISENEDAPLYYDIDALGSSIGYILANVRTGDESSPVEGAAVTVTALVDGKRMILASGVTDRNGTTRKFEVPVPDNIHSQAPDPTIRPYSLYDITVAADGFFNARSVDVPVFSGITSVQNFNMIPVPLMVSPTSETQTYYNKEPFNSGKE